MKKKVLFVATVDKGHILKFHIPYLRYFKEKGFEVHVACAGDAEIPYCDKKHVLPFEKSPLKFSNFQAYRGLKIIIEQNHFALVHCHTPMGAVIGRLAAKGARKKGTKILYTAHGFHFYKGASIINWLLFYPIEKFLSLYTDCLITINNEDYQNAMKRNFKAKDIKLVNGVGVDLVKFSPQVKEEKSELRNTYHYKDKDFILIYTADLNNNKHQDLLINSIGTLKTEIPNIKLLLAGEGPLEKNYKKLVNDLGLEEEIHFLGFRADIPNLLKLSDIAVSTSRREGLPLNLMEAMATGLPLVVTDSRGNRDLVNTGENGFVVGIDDTEGFILAIKKLYGSTELRERFGKRNIEQVKQYSLESILNKMDEIYSDFI
jgi:glycosyltransferase EpsD